MIPIYGISIDSVDLYLSVNRSDNRGGAAVSPDRGQRRRMRRIFQLSVGVVLTEDLTWALGLERQLQYLTDRTAILDCIARNARGCDRHDSALLASSYHDDGMDEHGYAVNPGRRYPEYANKAHSAGSLHNMHNITTHTCEIDGDAAHCES